jgi:hypothetical protein
MENIVIGKHTFEYEDMNDAYYLHMAHGIELRLQQHYNYITKSYENLFFTQLIYKLKPINGTSKKFKGTIAEVTKYIVENLDIFKPF